MEKLTDMLGGDVVKKRSVLHILFYLILLIKVCVIDLPPDGTLYLLATLLLARDKSLATALYKLIKKVTYIGALQIFFGSRKCALFFQRKVGAAIR